jgi:hypothetical protein
LEPAAEGNPNVKSVWGVYPSHWEYIITFISPIPQHYRRKFIINQKLAHMNEQNFVKLGAWWGQKMSRAYKKLDNAVNILHILNLQDNYLRGQWHAQRDSVTTKTPGKVSIAVFVRFFDNTLHTRHL